ncbi:hypothetical protein PV328_012275, partial [Microctonus aethiopoides]
MWRKSLNDVKSRRRRDRLRMTCNGVHGIYNINVSLLNTADVHRPNCIVDIVNGTQFIGNDDNGNVQAQNENDLHLPIVGNNEQDAEYMNAVENGRYDEQRVEQVFVEEEMECLSSDDDGNNTSGSEEELEEPNIDANDNIPLYDGAPVTIAQ